jgi:hypothetical protein
MCRDEAPEDAMRRSAGIATLVVAAAVVGAAAFTLGRVTAPPGPPAPPVPAVGGYLDGLRAGQAQGRLEGRAEQEGAALPPGDRARVQDAFEAGYTAGANDAFAGYDGGWTLGVPWIVTLERGSGQIDYRFSSRTPVQPGVDYSLCPDGRGLCQHAR